MSSFYAAPRGSWLAPEDLDSFGAEPVAAPAVPADDLPSGRARHGGRTPSDAAAVWSFADAAAAAGRASAASPAVARQPAGALTLYGRSVRRAALGGVDAASEKSSATWAQVGLKRSMMQASSVEEVLDLVARGVSEFDPMLGAMAMHRLARMSRDSGGPAKRFVLGHAAWQNLVAKVKEAIGAGAPRQLASTAWAAATMQLRDMGLLDTIAERCLRRPVASSAPEAAVLSGTSVPMDAPWDTMSLSLVLQSFGTLGVRNLELARSVTAEVQRALSASWPPSDVARIAWACAKLACRDDGFFRDASCKALARLSEASPTILCQCVWSFATAAPPSVTAHFFPYAAEAMLQGDCLRGHSSAHLAMVAWSFAVALYRPLPLLEAIGDIMPLKAERMCPQDITMVAWSYATLLAPQRRVFDFLARAAEDLLVRFNAQDLSNTVWAFATAGELDVRMLNAVADEACRRPGEFNAQHVAMLIWSYVTLRHRHDELFAMVGRSAHVDRSSWHSSKLLAYALAGLPKLGARLGTDSATRRVATELVYSLRARASSGTGEPDDAHTVHDAAWPWLGDAAGGEGEADAGGGAEAQTGWHDVDDLVARSRCSLQELLRGPEFEAILDIDWWLYDEPTVRAYQRAVQALSLRGLGSVHTWRLLSALGVSRAAAAELAALAAEARRADAEPKANHVEGRLSEAGRGSRANWCFWRARVGVRRPGGPSVELEERGRLQSSTVCGYREDCGGLTAVKLSHDHVSHRAWDCEFRAMARIAAAARSLLAGLPHEIAQVLLACGAAAESHDGASVPRTPEGRRELEAKGVNGHLDIYMTEVPCLSCVCAMAQFARRFPEVDLRVAWDGMTPEHAPE